MDKRYARIPNAVLDGLARKALSAYEVRILAYVLRKTFGWNVHYIRLKAQAASDYTGIPRQNVYRAVDGLLSKGVLLEGRDEKGRRGVKVNLDVGTWCIPASQTELDFDASVDGEKADIKLAKGGEE